MVAVLLLFSFFANAQVGVGTTSPNSTLDVRGSLSVNYRAFSASTSAGTTDNMLVFTGTSAATLTLPDATACTGRVYRIKNASSNTSALTIATTSSQTIDGLSSWSLAITNQTLILISNGTNWYAITENTPGNGAGSSWKLGGNNVSSEYKLGTIGNYDIPFITNNTEVMRLTTGGNLGIGTSSFDGINPERLLVDAGATGNTNFQNVIVALGNTNSYAQFNIQNQGAGGQASTDIVATADNGTETSNYIDLGINSSTYNNGASSLLNGANNAYLYAKGQDFIIGNSSSSKSMVFFTGGDAPANEKFRINSSGFVMTAGVASDILPSATNTYNLGSSTKRWATIYSNNALNTSDARLKKNIADLHYGLYTVMNMRPVQYDWKDNSEKVKKMGFLAQELRKVIPEVVVGDESKENLAVNYIEIIPVLVKAIQEQQQQIQAMAKEIKMLKRKH